MAINTTLLHSVVYLDGVSALYEDIDSAIENDTVCVKEAAMVGSLAPYDASHGIRGTQERLASEMLQLLYSISELDRLESV